MVSTNTTDPAGATPNQAHPPRRPRRHGARWHGADILGGYLLGLGGLFAACAARIELKTVLWGFGLFHGGCALLVFTLWWQDTQRRAAARPRPPVAVEVTHQAGGVPVAEPGVPGRRAAARE